MTIDLILTGLIQSLVLAIVAYAVMIPFRLLNFADLTSEGAYPIGGAICASSLIMGAHPLLAMSCAILGAGVVGIATSIVHLKFKVNTMLAGIIISTMAYSVNLRILSKPNVALFDTVSLFDQDNVVGNVLIILLILAACIVPLLLFLRTDFGLRLRTVGLNTEFACRQGICVAKYTIFGLFLAGCFSGLAGSLAVQLQSYMDVGMGIGMVIHALAALMIGEAVIGNCTMTRQLAAPLVGAIIYQQIQGAALYTGLEPSDLKFFTGAVVLIVMAMKRMRSSTNLVSID